MKAAVVTSFDHPPVYEDFADPGAKPGHIPVRMLAAGVHRLVQSIAAGAHYSVGDALPFVAGVDGIALTNHGTRIYTGRPPSPLGTIAQLSLVPEHFAVPVPTSLDTATAAAIVNPAMSSWMPLTDRVQLPTGGTVMILGATGTAGSLAVRIALYLGAGHVIAAGRNAEALNEVAFDSRVTPVVITQSFADDLSQAAAGGIDVVLDYVWGAPAEVALTAIATRIGTKPGRPVSYVHIGGVAGRTITLDGALLRSADIRLLGSGLGSISPKHLLQQIPRIFDFAEDTPLALPVHVAPLSEVEVQWDAFAPTGPRSRERLVLSME